MGLQNNQVGANGTGARSPKTEKLPGKTGGVYIPPFKLAQMLAEQKDTTSEAYQKLSWDALRKSINGLVNRVNASNVPTIVVQLLKEVCLVLYTGLMWFDSHLSLFQPPTP
jgi:hypothetical protein